MSNKNKLFIVISIFSLASCATHIEPTVDTGKKLDEWTAKKE